MNVLCAILIMILSSASSALYVAFRYEKNMRHDAEKYTANIENDYRRVSAENIDCKMEIARDQGISIGRQCDALQQQMIKSLKKGDPVSIRTGRQYQQDA